MRCAVPEPAAADDDLHARGGLRVAIPIRPTAQTSYDQKLMNRRSGSDHLQHGLVATTGIAADVGQAREPMTEQPSALEGTLAVR